jgi:hypothetical protein
MAFGIPNLERELSLFLEGVSGITAIRNVEYDKRYLWVIDFPDTFAPPSPFDDFFPISDITLPFASVNEKLLPYGQSELSIPINESTRDMSITFYDDKDQTLFKYFKDWMQLDIKNNGQFMSGLQDSHTTVARDSFNNVRRVWPTRTIRLIKYDAYRTETAFYRFSVYPKGTLDFVGSQASEAQDYTVTFAIVDDLSSKPKKASIGGFTFETVRQALGRFL